MVGVFNIPLAYRFALQGQVKLRPHIRMATLQIFPILYELGFVGDFVVEVLGAFVVVFC